MADFDISGITDDRALWELIDDRARDTPDHQIAIDEDGRSLTAREFLAAAERAAGGLHAMGIRADTPVSWMLPTWLESAVLVAALARLGAVQNPLLPILGPREMRFITGQTGARLFVVPSKWRDRSYADEAREIAKDQPGLEVLECDRHLPDGDPTTLPPPPTPSPAAAAPVRWIFYTSGTTADPKGARHTDHSVKASAIGMIKALEITANDRSAMVFPFTHIGGIGWLFTMALTGCTGVFVESFVPQTTIPVLQKERITLGGAGTPFHMAYLAAQRLQPDTPLFPEARVYPGGGASKPPQLHYEVKEELGGVGVVSGWGLTEAPILTMNTVRDSDVQLAETEGAPTPGVQLRVMKLDGTPAETGDEGELRAKGPQICQGYLDSSLDADAFDEDGWFRTGDLGVIDADNHVTITGRLKDVIIRHGENISAKELEDLLFTHPKIADAAVIGLPDPRTGERACAVVVPEDESDPPTLPDIFDFLTAKGLAKQKVPERLELVDLLPRNPAGKILKHELRAKYSA
jgi:acyl-CoA synthetase (AMP-forming)/AMP-acid ligase II